MDVDEFETPKKRVRQAGAKGLTSTLYKIVSQLKPTNMLLWGVVAEQYRGELEARQMTPRRSSRLQNSRSCEVVLSTNAIIVDKHG